jgi:hypothetical protein
MPVNDYEREIGTIVPPIPPRFWLSNHPQLKTTAGTVSHPGVFHAAFTADWSVSHLVE